MRSPQRPIFCSFMFQGTPSASYVVFIGLIFSWYLFLSGHQARLERHGMVVDHQEGPLFSTRTFFPSSTLCSINKIWKDFAWRCGGVWKDHCSLAHKLFLPDHSHLRSISAQWTDSFLDSFHNSRLHLGHRPQPLTKKYSPRWHTQLLPLFLDGGWHFQWTFHGICSGFHHFLSWRKDLGERI